MDAILGRDDRLVAKLVDAAEKVEAGFAAVIGTPVPAVIARFVPPTIVPGAADTA